MSSRSIPSPPAATTLLPHLIATLSDTKRTRVKEMLTRGLVSVNGAVATRHDTPLRPGDSIAIAGLREAKKARALPFAVLYEDAHLIAIDKPAGLLSIATEKEWEQTAYAILMEALAPARERVFIVHRLDRESSGVLMLAKTEAAKQAAMSNWKAAEKIYLALVEGTPEPRAATLMHHLHEDDRLKMHATEKPTRDSMEARLSYRVERVVQQYAMLSVELDTGRKNQIRVQLAAIGHPIAGDEKYGAKSNPLKRLGLHASRLSLPHPITGEALVIEAPIPDVMAGYC